MLNVRKEGCKDTYRWKFGRRTRGVLRLRTESLVVEHLGDLVDALVDQLAHDIRPDFPKEISGLLQVIAYDDEAVIV